MKAARESGKSGWVRTMALAAVLGVGLAANVQPQEQPRPQGQREGIRVHGHWTIEIRNPDGTLVSRDEFENALDSGHMTLAGLLGRRMSNLFWTVELHGPGSDNPCESGGQPVPCFVTEPSIPGVVASPWNSTNLEVLVPIDSNGVPAGTVELKGSIAAARATSIVLVRSAVSATIAGAGGPIPFNRVFTRRDLGASSKAVQPGQIIQVSVVFSFS